ncbi:hypothetical protein BG015_004886 [Linnemannia schmuckeri]|uniref:Uncharacterized protein n=1 Tax=Linnemannia schmuckeri TaxID=64567 RepID=A0A9P5S247_9FUNG|nr:hypothetical protein BG015_004886 [Linnemannia schmuckeri]
MPVPMIVLSDDTASSLDFAFSDLTSIEDPSEDAQSLWSHDDEMDSSLSDDTTMYDDSEVEDMWAMEEMNALVVDIPKTMGWLQVFEHALSTFRTSFELELDWSDSDTIHPIKAWVREDEDYIDRTDHQTGKTARTAPKGSSPPASDHHRYSPLSMPPSQPQTSILSLKPSLVEQERIQVVKRQMSALSLDTLRRLQTQQYYTYHRQHPQHSPQIQDTYEEEADGGSSSTLLAAALSALRQFHNHVKSNLMDSALDEELVSDLSRLGFAGDLGMVVAEGSTRDQEELITL